MSRSIYRSGSPLTGLSALGRDAGARRWDADEKIVNDAAVGFDAEVTYKETAPQLIGDEARYKKVVLAVYADAQLQAPVLTHVKAPAAMRGLHELLAAAAKSFAARLGKAEKAILAAPAIDPTYDTGAGPLSVTKVGLAMIGGEVAASAYQGDAKDWMQELIFQLRRAQITVPLWVKQVGVV